MPFTPQDSHDLLIAHGYEHTFHPCTFEDCGDPENGPELSGDPEYHEYASITEYLYCLKQGVVQDRVERDAAFELEEDRWFRNQDGTIIEVQDRTLPSEYPHYS